MAKKSRSEQALRHSWSVPVTEGVAQNHVCRVAVMGVGNDGCSVAARLRNDSGHNADYIAMDTEHSGLKRLGACSRIQSRNKSATDRTIAARAVPEKQAIPTLTAELESALSKYELVFVTADLRDEKAGVAAASIARLMRERAIVTIGVISKHSKQATDQLANLQAACDTVVVTESGKTEDISNTIKELIDVVSSPNTVNFDLSDFRSLIKKGAIAAVWTAEADSVTHVEEAMRNALANPLLDSEYHGLTGALIHVSADSPMAIQEATHMSQIVTESMENDAKIMWGSHVNPEQPSKLKVTLLMTGTRKSRPAPVLSIAAPSLFNLDPDPERERTLNLNLDLHQLE